MSYVSHQSIGFSRILEFWNLEYYVIIFCLLFTEKVNFLLVNKEKEFSVKTGLRSWKKSKQILRNIWDLEIPKFEKTQLIDSTIKWDIIY